MLSRLALRLAAIEALAPAVAVEAGTALPTIAGPRVYDSRQDAIDGVDEIEGKPILLVYTEDTVSTSYSDKGPPDSHACTLVVECMIAAKGIITYQAGDQELSVGDLQSPVMEPQHEALLDLLEATVRRRLDGRYDIDDATLLLRKVATRFDKIESIPARDDSRTVRLAARTLLFSVKIFADKWPEPSLTPANPTGLDALPEPLRSVAYALPAASPGVAICARMAAALVNPAALVALERVDGKAWVGRASMTGTPDATLKLAP